MSAALDTLPPVAKARATSAAEVDALLAAGAPVVLEGLVAHWPAAAAAAQGALDDYLLAIDRGAPAPVMEAPAAARGRFGYAPGLRDFSFAKRQRGLAETLARIARAAEDPASPCIAIQMLPLARNMPDFVRDNAMPLVPASAAPKLWLGGPVRTQIHNDRDHNLACVIAGRRRFVLFPPEQVANLYIGPPDNPPPLSLVDPEAPDLDAFPRFREALAAAQVAQLGPGDALLMPRWWWHHVTSRDACNAMVNYWWGGESAGLGNPHDCFLAALLAIKTLAPGERRYWRALFDAHVFAESDEAVAHIPPALRGSLGALSPRERAALKRRLQMAVLTSS